MEIGRTHYELRFLNRFKSRLISKLVGTFTEGTDKRINRISNFTKDNVYGKYFMSVK